MHVDEFPKFTNIIIKTDETSQEKRKQLVLIIK